MRINHVAPSRVRGLKQAVDIGHYGGVGSHPHGCGYDFVALMFLANYDFMLYCYCIQYVLSGGIYGVERNHGPDEVGKTLFL